MVRIGQHLNELCDRFYFKFGSNRSQWPTNHPEQRQLRDLLEKARTGLGVEDNDILDFVERVGLAGDRGAYIKASRHNNWKA